MYIHPLLPCSLELLDLETQTFARAIPVENTEDILTAGLDACYGTRLIDSLNGNNESTH